METLKGTVKHIQTANDPVLLRSWSSSDKPVNSVSFDPEMFYQLNKRQIAIGGADSIIYVYSMKPQGRPYKFLGHKGSINAVAFAPNGNIVASGGEDRILRVWKNNIYGKCSTIKGHVGSIRSISFSQDSSIVLTSSDDKTIKGWNVVKRNFMFALPGHSNWVRASKFAPDSRCVVSGSDDCTVRVWDVSTSSELHRFRESPSLINSVDWISDGTSVCAGGADGSVNLWDVRSMKLIQHYDVSKGSVNSVSVHPSGNYLATGDDESHIKIWDLRAGRLGWLLYTHKESIKGVSFNKAGDYFGSCGQDGTFVWKSNFDEQNIQRNVVNFGDQQVNKSGSAINYTFGGSVTQTSFKANKQVNINPMQTFHEPTMVPKTNEVLSEGLATQFERIVNQMERVTQLIQSLDQRLINNEREIMKLYENPKARSLLQQYEQQIQDPQSRYAVWESFKSRTHELPQQQELEPLFDTGSFMRNELIDDYPDDNDQQLQADYDQNKYEQSDFAQTQQSNEFNETNPFQQGALSSTSVFAHEFQRTAQQTFSTRMNLTEQLGELGDWRNKLEELKRELPDHEPQDNELVIREEAQSNESDGEEDNQ